MIVSPGWIMWTPVRASRAIAALFMCCERNLCILDKSIGQEEAPELDCCSISSSSSCLCSKVKGDVPLLLLRRCCFFCCDLRLEADFGIILGGPRKARRSVEVGMVAMLALCVSVPRVLLFLRSTMAIVANFWGHPQRAGLMYYLGKYVPYDGQLKSSTCTGTCICQMQQFLCYTSHSEKTC